MDTLSRERRRRRTIGIGSTLIGLVLLIWAIQFNWSGVARGPRPPRPTPAGQAMDLLFADGPASQIQSLILASCRHPDRIGRDGYTVLYWAVDREREDLVLWLLGQGADPNGAGREPPLRWAVHRGYARMAEILLRAGADPDLVFDAGGTPRQIARLRRNEAILALMPPEAANGPATDRSDPSDEEH